MLAWSVLRSVTRSAAEVAAVLSSVPVTARLSASITVWYRTPILLAVLTEVVMAGW